MKIADSINYNFNGLEEAKVLTDIVEQKCHTLEKYLHGNESVSCDVEFQKVASSNKGLIYRMEVNLRIDGTLYRAEATEESFEKAIDSVKADLDRELRHAKEKSGTLDKQAGREAKEQLLSQR